MPGYDKPLPVIDETSRGFWQAAHEHRFTLQRCGACRDWHFPPSPVCPNCLSSEQAWEPASGRGVLVSWVRFHRAYWDSLRGDVPYDVCLVRLDEGPLFVGNFLGATPDGLRQGMALRVAFDDVTESITLPRFVAE